MLFKPLNLLGQNSCEVTQPQDKSSSSHHDSVRMCHKAEDYYDPEDRGQTLEDKLDSISQAAHKRPRK